MLSIYDLYDLYAVFVSIRSFPNDEVNREIIDNIYRVLTNWQDNCEPNQFRIELQGISDLRNREHYEFVFTNNRYSYYPLSFLKESYIYDVLIKACQNLKEAIKEGNEKKIYDLADCLHDLPIIIVENRYTIPKFYWKKYVDYYRKKWDMNFLRAEEKHRKQSSKRSIL